eukprot:SAG11_NODE_416_length_9669_cov_7.135528_6_plen_52_part_00
MGGISSVSGGVLWMGIMPSHEDGRAKNAARDNNVMGFHSVRRCCTAARFAV